MNIQDTIKNSSTLNDFFETDRMKTDETSTDAVWETPGYYWGCPYCDGWHWQCTYCFNDRNDTEQAFKVVKVLVEKDILKIDSLKEFFKIMDVVQKSL